MAKHTAGPWHYRTMGDGSVSVRAGNQMLAHCRGQGDANETNAALIADAPDMLECLRKCHAKANHAKDNPRAQTDALFDILELTNALLARHGVNV